MQGYPTLTRIGNSLLIEVLTSVATLDEVASCSAYKVDDNFLVLVGDSRA